MKEQGGGKKIEIRQWNTDTIHSLQQWKIGEFPSFCLFQQGINKNLEIYSENNLVIGRDFYAWIREQGKIINILDKKIQI